MKPSILLTGAAQGGIVNNIHIAAQLAAAVLESRLSHGGVLTASELRVDDAGDRWLVVPKEAQAQSVFRDEKHQGMEIYKQDAKFSFFNNQEDDSDIIFLAALAQRFAAIIITNLRGEAELIRQLPLLIKDEGKTWLLTGSGSADNRFGGPGACHFEIQKHDARVVDMRFDWVLKTSPETRDHLKAVLKRPTNTPRAK